MRFYIRNIDITPPFKTHMGGYGARRDYFDRVNDPLACTVLLLEAKGKQVLIIAADLVKFDNEQAVALRRQLAAQLNISTENVLLNASHTHGGPEMSDWAMYFSSGHDTQSTVNYRNWLAERISKAVKSASENMEAGTLWYGIGKSSIPMNRRLERDGKIILAPNPEGAVDDRLHVLAIKNARGELCGLGIMLACHPVATGAQHLITADFPGAFKKACEEFLGNNVTAFFLQGAGGDMRPRPAADNGRWRQMDHSELLPVGQQIFKETLAVLHNSKVMKELKDIELTARFEYAVAPCEKNYCKRKDFEKLLANGNEVERIYAENALKRLASDEIIPDKAKIGVHTIWLNKDTAIIGLQGEPLIGLGAYVENKLIPKKIILLGYTNGCGSYLPGSQEMKRGGYEQSSWLYAGWTGPYKLGLEDIITSAVFTNP